MRAQARENRERLLEAAEDLFARKGVSASVAEIVKAAGVGPPTLYRHFGDKQGLVDAIGERRYAVTAAHMATALAQPTGMGGIRAAIEQHIDLSRENLAIREMSGVAVPERLERMLLTTFETLVERAHAEGSLRKDFAATDIPFLISAVGAVVRTAGYDPALRQRYVSMILGGLRPNPPDAPLGRPPTEEQVRKAFAPQYSESRAIAAGGNGD